MNINPDLLIFQIVPLLSLRDIKRFCLTESNISKINQDNRLWQNLFNRDFPHSGSKLNISWFKFYLESYQYRKLVQEKYQDVVTRPYGISYAKYYQLLGTANKVKLTSRIGDDGYTDNLGFVYVIPNITTLGDFFQNVQQHIDKINYKGDYELEFATPTAQFCVILSKIGNKYFAKDSFGTYMNNNNTLNSLFGLENIEVFLFKEDHCPFTFHLSDQNMNKYLL